MTAPLTFRAAALLRRCFAAVVRWALAAELQELEALRSAAKTNQAARINQAVEVAAIELRLKEVSIRINKIAAVPDQLKALQAVDLGWRERGKIIVAAAVNGRDVVKIIDVPAHWHPVQYREMVADLERRYGAVVARVDAPYELAPFVKTWSQFRN